MCRYASPHDELIRHYHSHGWGGFGTRRVLGVP